MKKTGALVRDIAQGKYTEKEITLIGIILVLAGIIVGILCSPKKYIVLGSFNGNNFSTENMESGDEHK